jgi:hypothetical protein
LCGRQLRATSTRSFAISFGGAYLFDAYLNGVVNGGSELFLFFGAQQLFTGTTAAPRFSTGTWTGDSNSNIIYGTDLNNRYEINNAVLTISTVSTPEPPPRSLFGIGLALFVVGWGKAKAKAGGIATRQLRL